MSDIEARPNRMAWPPLIYLSAIAASVALNMAYPLPYFGSPLSDILFAAGILMVGGALAIGIAAFRTLTRHKTTVRPTRGAEHLVTSGPFSFTRNPIYLANTMMTVGFGLAAGIVWFFPLALVAAWLTQIIAIRREERHLEIRFGKRYRDYAKRVRRWI